MSWRWFTVALVSGLICLVAILAENDPVSIISAVGYLVGTVLCFRSVGT